MFRMPLKFLKALVGLVLTLLLVQPPTEGKCISLQVTLKGKIEGPTRDHLRVIVEISSATQGDSDTDVRQKSSIEESDFLVVAWFNTTSNVVAAETCDRRPHLVTVKLMQGDQVLDRQELTVERDFRLTKTRDYELKKPITLHAAAAPVP
jgi:hypothetical protein